MKGFIMKKIRNKLLAVLTFIIVLPVYSKEIIIQCWHPYTPPAQAFNIYSIDPVNEAVIYANSVPAKDGCFYVGIYEGPTNSASLIRVPDRETSDRVLFYITKYMMDYLEIVPVIRANLMYEKYNTETVEENLDKATRSSYFLAIENLLSWIDTIAIEENVELVLPMNDSGSRTNHATCNVTENYQKFLGRLKTEFEETIPSIKEKYSRYLAE